MKKKEKILYGKMENNNKLLNLKKNKNEKKYQI